MLSPPHALPFAILLLPLAACAPKAGDSASPEDAAPTPCVPGAFSLALLTDTHIGEGIPDHGGEGWEDTGGDGGVNAPTLEEAVARVNEVASSREDLGLALILGDLTDSGERSEFERARAILDGLSIPYLPLLGNHDAWPYAWSEATKSWDEAPAPVGDVALQEVFANAFAAAADAFPSLRRADPVWNEAVGAESAFVDFSVELCGHRILAVDTSTRLHTPTLAPGIGPEADLSVAPGGPRDWLQGELLAAAEAEQRVLVLSHHPFVAAGEYTFPEPQIEELESFLEADGLVGLVHAFIAGHIHLDASVEGPGGIPVRILPASKDDPTPRILTLREDGSLEGLD